MATADEGERAEAEPLDQRAVPPLGGRSMHELLGDSPPGGGAADELTAEEFAAVTSDPPRRPRRSWVKWGTTVRRTNGSRPAAASAPASPTSSPPASTRNRRSAATPPDPTGIPPGPLSTGVPTQLYRPRNMLAYMLFTWISKVVHTAVTRTLSAADMPDVPTHAEAQVLADRLEAAWVAERQCARQSRDKGGRRTALFARAFARCFLPPWLTLVALFFFESASQVVQTLFLRRIIDALSDLNDGGAQAHGRLDDAYLYAGLLSVFTLLRILINHLAFFKGWMLAMKTRAACIGLIYRETLRMSSQTIAQVSTGHVVNLASNDVERLVGAALLVQYVLIGPLMLITVAYFVWQEIGAASLAGVGLLVAMIPLNLLSGRFFARFRMATTRVTDRRVRSMSEILSGMGVLKMYSWAAPFAILVSKLRAEELACLRKTLYLDGANRTWSVLGVVVVSFLSLMTYELTGNNLTAVKAFSTVAFFSIARLPVTTFFPLGVQMLSEMLVLLGRMHKLLTLEPESVVGEEGRRQHTDTSVNSSAPETSQATPPLPVGTVRLEHVTCSWEVDRPVLQDLDLAVQPGELLAVVGPVGAGKSTLLMALLGELVPKSGQISIRGSLAYHAQEPWILAGTVQENICFGAKLDPAWYDQVLDACALRPDLLLFEDGDQTEIGERGITLSGGQKARISLARTVYTRSAIALLDDPLSAVDAKVGEQLYRNAIAGVLSSTTRILVTHQLNFARRADRVLVLDEHGRVVGLGTADELERQGVDVSSWLGAGASVDELELPSEGRGSFPPTGDEDGATGMDKQDAEREDQSGQQSDQPKKPARKLIEAEKVQEGAIGSSAYAEYMRATGSVGRAVAVLCMFLLTQAALIMADWYLAHWTDLPENEREDDSNLIIYALLVLGGIVLAFCRTLMFYFSTLRASQTLHDASFRGVLGTSLRFFDSQPVGRILNRFSSDLGLVDFTLPSTLVEFLQMMCLIGGFIILISSVNPWLFLLTCPMVIFFVWMRRYFLHAVRQTKRIEGAQRSPVFSLFSNTLHGLPTIRAFRGSTMRFRREFEGYQNAHSRAYLCYIGISRWLGTRLDLANFVFVVVVSFAAIAARNALNPGTAGLSIIYSISLTSVLQLAVRNSADVENHMTSVERVLEYTKLAPEEDHVDCSVALEQRHRQDGGENHTTHDVEAGLGRSPCPNHLPAGDKAPGPDWPQSGELVFDSLTLRYAKDTPDVLRGISLTIQDREKIGIVGRTGAGKSSLLAALFRLSPTGGTIFLDGVPTCSVPLDKLRRAISVIPQDPILFTATLRQNLDPFDEASDEAVLQALQQVQLGALAKQLGLEAMVTERGGNFSVGQRQLICLARAMLRPTRVLVMDEATANVDLETDALIQRAIRTLFADRTVLTIAHRLNTILDSDRVMVLDKGQLREFAAPAELIARPDSIFSSMCAAAGLGLADIHAARARAAGQLAGNGSALQTPHQHQATVPYAFYREDEI